jgi:hypothetical protein
MRHVLFRAVRARCAVVFALVFVSVPSLARAQLSVLEGVFSKLESINATYGPAWQIGVPDLAGRPAYELSFEATFYLGTTGCAKAKGAEHRLLDYCEAKKKLKASADTAKIEKQEKKLVEDLARVAARCDKAKSTAVDSTTNPPTHADSVKAKLCSTKAVARADSLMKSSVQYHQGDSTIVSKYAAAGPPDDVLTEPKWQFEAALGYLQLSQFNAMSKASGAQLTGGVKEYPYVAVYADLFPKRPVTPYFGLRFGLSGLDNFVADTGGIAVATATRTTPVVGASAGISLGTENLNILFELAYSCRFFGDIAWAASTPPAGASSTTTTTTDNAATSSTSGDTTYTHTTTTTSTASLPAKTPLASLPKSLNASTFSLHIGVQFHIPKLP